jgi:hypothetical protein
VNESLRYAETLAFSFDPDAHKPLRSSTVKEQPLVDLDAEQAQKLSVFLYEHHPQIYALFHPMEELEEKADDQ